MILLFYLFGIFQIILSCDNIAKLDITEEQPHQARSLMDLSQKLNQYISTNSLPIDRESIYLTDKLASRPFSLEHGNLIITGRIDRESICDPKNQQLESLSQRCCQNQCCMFIGISWLNKDTSNNKDINDIQPKTLYIRIDIKDINDHTPTFSRPEIIKHIHENNQLGYTINLPAAKDDDSELYGVIRYQLKHDNQCPNCFKVITNKEKQPVLIIKQSLDRELYPHGFQLKLLAIDGGNPAQTGVLTINIKLEDLNDNAPKFDQPIIILNLPEDKEIARTLSHINVYDKDIGINSQVDYEIEDFDSIAQQYFKLIPMKNGVDIQLQSQLDYEKYPLVEFKIIARDQGSPSLSSTATVTVRITNINDMKPEIFFYKLGSQIDPNLQPIEKRENGPKHDTIILIHVTDSDSALSDLYCDVFKPKNEFYLKEIQVSDPIVKKKQYELKNSIIFDREDKSLYNIEIRCSDESSLKKLTSSAKLQLKITDINDNKPIFSSNFYVGYIKETNNIGERVNIKDGPIKATDLDEGINSQMLFELKNINNSDDANAFSIDSNLAIHNKIILDYELKKEYKMLLIAKDMGIEKSLSTSILLTIKIQDVNDNAPRFIEKFYGFSVKEEEPIGTEIGQLNATDADTAPRNKDLIYEIQSLYGHIRNDEDPKRLLMIDNNNGKIKTKAKLDREKVKHLSFMVKVRNSNHLIIDRNRYNAHSDSVSVSIKIDDINDQRPQLMKKLNNGKLEKYNYNERPSIILKKETSYISNPCTVFPFKFIDDDEGLNAEIKVTLKKNAYFKLDMDHSLFCPINDDIRPGFYTVYVIGEDRNGGNGSIHSEYPLKVQVISPIKKFEPLPRRPPRRTDDDSMGLDRKTVIIFIGLIATIIIFFILLAFLIVRSKVCMPRYTNTDNRKPDQLNRDRNVVNNNNNSWNKPGYKGPLNDQLVENKRLWSNIYDTHSGLTSTGLLISPTNTTVSQKQQQQQRQHQPQQHHLDIIPSSNHESTSNIMNNNNNNNVFERDPLWSQSCDNLVGLRSTPISLVSPPTTHYEHMLPKHKQLISSTTLPQHQQQQQHLYNYLIDSSNTMLPSQQHITMTTDNIDDDNDDINNMTSSASLKYKSLQKSDNIINNNNNNNNNNQKSINDVYLQTSFV